MIEKLHPSIQPLARKLIESAASNGIVLAITQGLRTNEEQERLYAQGRTAPGVIVTNARPGTSWHNYGLAFDVAIVVHDKITWPNDVHLWKCIGELGKMHGLEWGGDFHTFVDRPHFEYHPGLTLLDAMQGKRPNV
jgi:peptidoglycan L-alanyl-D-glutamate endopeptidase CwlK